MLLNGTYSTTPTSGISNTYIGINSGIFNSGDINTFLGSNTGYSMVSGSGNVFIGSNAGYDITTGGGNVVIGGNVDTGTGPNNNIWISDGSGDVALHYDATNLFVNKPLVSKNRTILQQTSELIGGYIQQSGNVFRYYYDSGSIWYHNTPLDDDFIVDIVNYTTYTNPTAPILSITQSNGYVVSTFNIVIPQGITAYGPLSFRINGVTQSVRWATQSNVNNNQIDVIGYTVFDILGTYSVLGQINTFI